MWLWCLAVIAGVLMSRQAFASADGRVGRASSHDALIPPTLMVGASHFLGEPRDERSSDNHDSNP